MSGTLRMMFDKFLGEAPHPETDATLICCLRISGPRRNSPISFAREAFRSFETRAATEASTTPFLGDHFEVDQGRVARRVERDLTLS